MTKFLGPFIYDSSAGETPSSLTWVNTSEVSTAYSESASSDAVGLYYNRNSATGGPVILEISFYDNLGNELSGVDYNYARFVTANLIDAFNSSPTDVIIEPRYPSGFPTRNIEVS